MNIVASNAKPLTNLINMDGTIMKLKDVVVPQKFYDRLKTGVVMLDSIFGGDDMPGILAGSSIVFTGQPGAGKSTMALQLAELFSTHAGRNVLYNIGEESERMVKFAADRIGVVGEFDIGKIEQIDDLTIHCETSGVEVLVVDSLQSMRDGILHGARLLKSVVKKLHKFAKDNDVTVIIIGHITKGGEFAGPQEIIHDVDAHAHLRLNKDSGNRVFELKKNRFGPAGVPYEFFLSKHGLDFHQIEEASSPKKKGEMRKQEITSLIKEKLLGGEQISGYCFERFNADCSGGFWRAMMIVARKELESEGCEIEEVRIDGRTHIFVAV